MRAILNQISEHGDKITSASGRTSDFKCFRKHQFSTRMLKAVSILIFVKYCIIYCNFAISSMLFLWKVAFLHGINTINRKPKYIIPNVQWLLKTLQYFNIYLAIFFLITNYHQFATLLFSRLFLINANSVISVNLLRTYC